MSNADSVITGTISGGLQQNRNMFNSSSLSLQTPPRQAQFNISHSNLLTSKGQPDTTAQTFGQQVSPATSDAMVLERISHDLLDDIDMEPTGAAEEAMVMSTVSSLSILLQQATATAPATAGSSQASNAHAGAAAAAAIAAPVNVPAEAATHQLLGTAPDVGSSGAGGGS
jgi:hypothetical protein